MKYFGFVLIKFTLDSLFLTAI
jgi:hypothetical protein